MAFATLTLGPSPYTGEIWVLNLKSEFYQTLFCSGSSGPFVSHQLALRHRLSTAKLLQYSSLSGKWSNCYRIRGLFYSWPLLILYRHLPTEKSLSWSHFMVDYEILPQVTLSAFPSHPPTFKAVPTTFLPQRPSIECFLRPSTHLVGVSHNAP